MNRYLKVMKEINSYETKFNLNQNEKILLDLIATENDGYITSANLKLKSQNFIKATTVDRTISLLLKKNFIKVFYKNDFPKAKQISLTPYAYKRFEKLSEIICSFA